MYYELTDHFLVPASIDQTWDFFSSAGNLPAITPPWLRFSIDTPQPIAMGPDTVLDYTIRWAGLPVKWRTRIIDWTPPRQFIDVQIRGPYTLWHHQHQFEPTSSGVACTDRVIYKLPAGPIGRGMHALMVSRQLREIFTFRRRVIGERLGGFRAVQQTVEIRTL